MLNDKIVKDIIDFVKDKEYNSLGSAIIFAYEGKKFCINKIVGCYDLQYEKQLEDDKVNRYVNQYFYDRVDNNFIYAILPDANEVIALLHEIGHIKVERRSSKPYNIFECELMAWNYAIYLHKKHFCFL